MRPKKFFFVLLGIAVLLGIIIIASPIGANVLFKKQANKLNEIKVQQKVVGEQQIALAQAKEDIGKYEELDKLARTIIPQDKDQAKTVREITKIAAQSGIIIGNITFPASALGQPNQPASSGDGTTAKPKIDMTQVTPVEGMDGVYALEITVTPMDNTIITYNQLIHFLEGLESNRRTAHVNKISIAQRPFLNGGITFSLTLNAYVKP